MYISVCTLCNCFSRSTLLAGDCCRLCKDNRVLSMCIKVLSVLSRNIGPFKREMKTKLALTNGKEIAVPTVPLELQNRFEVKDLESRFLTKV